MISAVPTEAKVIDVEARYRQLFEILPDAILIYNDGKCIFANPAAASLCAATSAKTLLGRMVIDLIHPDFREFFQQRINLAYGGKHENFQEIKILRLDGHSIDVEIMALAINSQGLPTLQMVLKDITSRRVTEDLWGKSKQQLRLEQTLIKLAQSLAHDFKNVLMAILANINLADIACTNPEEVRKRLAAAEEGCCQAQALVEQLEIFASGETPRKKPLDLAKIIKETARQAVIGAKSWVEVSVPEPLWPVEANRGQMHQVFGNLLINAAQAMPAGGMIKVQAQNLDIEAAAGHGLPSGRYVAVTVADQGMGIAPEHLSKIFDPLFTTKPQGAGLGLATIRAIVSDHDGHIAVESMLGKGTTFRVFLPAAGQTTLQVPEETR